VTIGEKDKQRLDQLFQYPLFQSLAHRRTRRFARGYEIHDKCFEYKSEKAPIPLSELETAVLAWAADGINGLSLGEAQTSTNVMQCWNGRTHANACNDQSTNFIIVNDDGVYMHKPKNATKIVEIETPEDRDKLLTLFGKTRPEFKTNAPRSPPKPSCNPISGSPTRAVLRGSCPSRT